MTRVRLTSEERRTLLSDRRAWAAAQLHRLGSWRDRTSYVRLLADHHGVAPVDTGGLAGWRLRFFGLTAHSTAGADGALANWAQAVMREFPELALP